ncbi:MAG: AAA family ATPase [Candidatus Peregrinibacteria bacterium]
MKLKKLRIKGFKNLYGPNGPDDWFEIDFEKTNGITVLVGNNGSGKSNVLEALSAIFSGLYKAKLCGFEYELNFEKDGKTIKVEATKDQLSLEIPGKRNDPTPKGMVAEQINPHLPSQIIAGYSGEETRLYEKYFLPTEKIFTAQIKKTTRSDWKNRLLYVDKKAWAKAFLTLALYNLEDLKKIVGSVEIDTISFTFNTGNIEKSQKNPNPISAFVERINPGNLAEKSFLYSELEAIFFDFLTDENENFITDENGTKIVTGGPIKKIKSGFSKGFSEEFESYYDKKEFYQNLSLAEEMGFITNISITFNRDLDILSLSEGQKKLILVKLILEVLADGNSLVLLDEPDSHIHVGNKEKLKSMMEEYSGKREIILTTHSPTLMHCFDEKNLVYLEGGKIGDPNRAKVLDQISGGKMSFTQQQILLHTHKDILLVEGKTDETYIKAALKKLKPDNPQYKDVEFEFLYMGGSDAETVKKIIKKFPPKEGQNIIAFFDGDGAGFECIQGITKTKTQKKDYKYEVFEKVYIVLYPKPDSFKEDHFEVEDYFGLDVLLRFKNQKSFKDFKGFSKKEFEKYCESEECKKEDFEGFKALFDLILEIKNEINP